VNTCPRFASAGVNNESRCPYQGKGWEKGKEDSGTGNLSLHTA